MCVSSSEFQPGVPWKGIDRVDPESDPYMTPGSMMGNAVSPNLNDSEHQLLQDNTGKHLPQYLYHKVCDDTRSTACLQGLKKWYIKTVKKYKVLNSFFEVLYVVTCII